MTNLKAIRKPTQEEKNLGAEIVFIRENQNQTEFKIYGAKCYESWEQWGTRREILGDNVEDIERWRKLNDEGVSWTMESINIK